MPINKIVATKRGKAAIAAALVAAAAAGWQSTKDTNPAKHVYPPAVILATDKLIKPWEGLVLKAHWDPFAKIYDICYGKTRINRKPVTVGMTLPRLSAMPSSNGSLRGILSPSHKAGAEVHELPYQLAGLPSLRRL